MFERVLKKFRYRIQTRLYVMTLHATEEMEDEVLSILDIENCVLNGKIFERQKDKNTAEWKYRIRGKSIEGNNIEIVTKVGPTDMLVIITVYSI